MSSHKELALIGIVSLTITLLIMATIVKFPTTVLSVAISATIFFIVGTALIDILRYRGIIK